MKHPISVRKILQTGPGKKANQLRKLLLRSYWFSFCYKKPIDEKLIFVESRDGRDFAGNILRIVEELASGRYGQFRICVYARAGVREKIRRLGRQYDFGQLSFVGSPVEAMPVLARAKYIVTDSGLRREYAKRPGQIVINTWHGTPLKLMGKRVDTEQDLIGPVQHLLLSTDYFVFPNLHTRDVMLRDYMVEHLARGKVLLSGYPRNEVFFHPERGEALRPVLGFEGKQVFAYLPTHRSNHDKNAGQLRDVLAVLEKLDAEMGEDQLLLVKLHVFNQSRIDFRVYRHIRPFPEEYETYDVLNAADVLITDYSSVLFDFANSGKKIILFAYDLEEYTADRGMYFPLCDMPFPIVDTPEKLLAEMALPKQYGDAAFRAKFCPFDGPGTTEKLCRHVFLGEALLEETEPGNGRDTLLLLGGDPLEREAESGLPDGWNPGRENACYAFWPAGRERVSRREQIPAGLDYLPFMCAPMLTVNEAIAWAHFKKRPDKGRAVPAVLIRAFEREKDRFLCGVSPERVLLLDEQDAALRLLSLALSRRMQGKDNLGQKDNTGRKET